MRGEDAPRRPQAATRPRRARKPPALPPESEQSFQSRVVALAASLGWLVFSIPDSRKATMRGWPDLSLVRARGGRPRVMFIECKTLAGKARPDQLVVLGLLTAAGMDARIARPSDWDALVEVLS